MVLSYSNKLLLSARRDVALGQTPGHRQRPAGKIAGIQHAMHAVVLRNQHNSVHGVGQASKATNAASQAG